MLLVLTLVHVAISLVAIAAGFYVLSGMPSSRRPEPWTAIFLVATVATSATGFLFPFVELLPSHVFGFVSLPLLAVAIVALYSKRLAGPWRPAYVITALIAQYLNFFVLIVQSFQKIPFLNNLAPTQTEAPFALAQGAALLGFLVLGYRAVKQFHPRLAAASPTGLVDGVGPVSH